jgi:hypothetical protein
MRLVLLAFITIITLCTLSCSSCKKETPNELPPPTQTGANTLSFTLDGQSWKPQGQIGVSANLAIDIDFGFNNGILGITAYRYVSGKREDFGIGIRDSLNFMSFPKNLTLGRGTLANARFANDNCNCDFYDTSIFRGGNLNITKLDKINKIISGTFNVILYKVGCSDTIKITDGRFDMKY